MVTHVISAIDSTLSVICIVITACQ